MPIPVTNPPTGARLSEKASLSALAGGELLVALQPKPGSTTGEYSNVNIPAALVGTVQTVDGLAPDSAGNVALPLSDIYNYSQAKRDQVVGFFTSTSQYYAADQPLTTGGVPDTSTFIGSVIYDRPAGVRYELAPDRDTPLAGGGATPTWYRTALP